MKKAIITLVSLFVAISIFAQNQDDALRYSLLYPLGTARYSAMGGAFGALGADLSLAAYNPAGLAIYRSSEFTITPSFVFTNSNASNDKWGKFNDFDFNFQLNNIGGVFTFKSPDKTEGWLNTNFALTYNRLKDFKTNVYAEGINNDNSLTDYFVNMANGNPPANLYQFEEGVAYNAYLLDTVGNATTYRSIYNGKYGELQSFRKTTKGSESELNFAFAGNYENKIYVGGSFNIQFIDYRHTQVIQEQDINDSIPGFVKFDFDDHLSTDGSGVNLKLGFIYKVNNWFRAGLAVHTPTFYSMSDHYYTELNSYFDTITYNVSSPNSDYDYYLITPARFISSFGFIFNQAGLFSLDVEAVNYGSSRMRSNDGYNWYNVNNAISTMYKWGINIRSGLEYNLGAVALRGGVAYYSSPYKDDKSIYTLGYNGGVRIRGERMYLDLTYSLLQTKERYYLYNINNTPAITINANNSFNYFTATLGLRF